MNENELIIKETAEDRKGTAGLQQKKNKLRIELFEKGILPKGAHNDYDNYDYFSEAQYKELFSGLFSKHGLEFDSTEVEIQSITGTEKQPFGVLATMKYIITDSETGYKIESVHSGIGIDKGDKAIYKAKTGALKSFFASTFLVATKDDPERDDDKPAPKKSYTKAVQKTTSKAGTISEVQRKRIMKLFENSKQELQEIMKQYKKKKITELDLKEASEIIKGKESEATNE
jgi:hypothetical protein